jgi:hypothetical protein
VPKSRIISSLKISSAISSPSSPRYNPPSYSRTSYKPTPSTPYRPPSQPSYDSGKYKGTKDLLRRLTKKKLYNVFVKRNNKWNKIASDVGEGAAKNIGAKSIFKDLARSFRVEESGRMGLDVSKEDFRYARLFRNPKGRTKLPRDTFVQINALGNRPEVEEIQLFRRLKKRKNKKYDWF